MKLLKILENTKWQWIACLWMIFSHLLSCYYIFVVKCVFHGFRWGPNAILTACIRRHIEKQGGKLDTNPLVSTTIIVTVWLTFFWDFSCVAVFLSTCCTSAHILVKPAFLRVTCCQLYESLMASRRTWVKKLLPCSKKSTIYTAIAQFAITINSNVCPHNRNPNTLMRESYAWRHRNI